jgi:hypothetical protein
MLAMAALAIRAVIAAQEKTKHHNPSCRSTLTRIHPPDTGLIALTVAEIKRLLDLLTHRLQPLDHHLDWTIWRQRHQARARWFHHRTRLQRQTEQMETP